MFIIIIIMEEMGNGVGTREPLSSYAQSTFVLLFIFFTHYSISIMPTPLRSV